jgi:HD-GYP domain-containing protein (c-di-GMP phosphodiesterase class II)
VVDSDNSYLNLLREESQKSLGKNIQLLYAKNQSEANDILSDRNTSLHSVFFNPGAFGFRVVPMISLIHQARPVTPIYFLYDKQPPFPKPEMSRLAIHSAVQKSLILKLLPTLIRNSFQSLTAVDLMRVLSVNDSPSTQLGHDDYIQIPVRDLLSGVDLFFDLYIQDEKQNYTRIVEPKDGFTFDHIRIYVDRGVKVFYLKKRNFERMIGYCELLSKNLMTLKHLSAEVKIVEVFNFGQDLVELVKKGGVSEEHIELSAQFAGYVTDTVQDLKKDNYSLIDQFINHTPAYDHAVTSTAIALLIGLSLQMESESVRKTVGIASFFHDLGLYSLPAELHGLSEDQLTEAQKQVYRTHPEKSAAQLARIQGIDETIIQAVAQHHERRDRSGFPGKTWGPRINRIAEIIGLSDEFIRLTKETKDREGLKKRLKDEVFPKFSFQVVEAFKNALIN